MEEKDFLSSLQNLKNSLLQLNSAREYVEKTIGSYDAVGMKIKNYADSLDAVSQNIKELSETIGSNHTLLADATNQELQSVLRSFSQSIKKESLVIGKTLDDFKTKTNELGDSFAKTINKTYETWRTNCEDIATTLKNSTWRTADSFAKETTDVAKTFSDDIEKIRKDFESLNAFVKEEVEKGQKNIFDAKDELLSKNEMLSISFDKKTKLLEKRYQILQKWIYLIVILIIILSIIFTYK